MARLCRLCHLCTEHHRARVGKVSMVRRAEACPANCPAAPAHADAVFAPATASLCGLTQGASRRFLCRHIVKLIDAPLPEREYADLTSNQAGGNHVR